MCNDSKINMIMLMNDCINIIKVDNNDDFGIINAQNTKHWEVCDAVLIHKPIILHTPS